VNTIVEPLSSIIDKITNKEILLPDFQRNFVWREEEKQSRLIASVLAKMPVGSILLLNSNSADYAYKMVGCKQRKTSSELGIQGEILALLDGQQRMTVLTNAFSNVVFEMAGSAANLVNQNALKRRFFLRIPKYQCDEETVEDFFGAKVLELPWKDAEKDEPDFLADEIYEAIKIIPFNATGTDCYNPFLEHQPAKSELINFCSTGKEYLIPLFLLTGNNDAWLTQILKRISENIQIDIVSEFDQLQIEERLPFVQNVLTKDIQELAEHPDRISERTEFESELKKQGDIWAASLKTYLVSCLNNIQLNQIIVDNRKRARAINIYENLNKGGVPLGTFELVMAKFASVSDENYHDKIVNNIKQARTYSEMIYSTALKNNVDIKNDINSESYSATVGLKCVDLENDDMVSAYIDAYLDVISLYSHCPDYDLDKLNVSLLKRDKILAVTPEALKDNCDAVVEALDLALFFFQMRCGIRNIKEMNYGLLLVVVAYLLLNPQYKNNPMVYDYLDAWYWCVMFSGYFNSDQTEKAIVCIKKLISLFNNQDTAWIKGLEQQIFKANYFTEKEFLLLNKDDETGIMPKDFLRDTICQFFMVNTYKGIFDNTVLISPFTKATLEKHHVIPLGSLVNPNEKIRKAEEPLRKKRDYFLNSPVNFIYITDNENNAISDDKISDYTQRIMNYGAKSLLGLIGNFDTSSEASCKQILASRYDDIVGKVQNHIDMMIP
jgi:hypothetical protein